MTMIENPDENPNEVADESEAQARLQKNGHLFLKAAQNMKFKILNQAATQLQQSMNKPTL